MILVYLLTPPAAFPTVSTSSCPLLGGIFSDPFANWALAEGIDGGGIFDSSVDAWFCACNSKFVTVCLLALLRVRMPPFEAPVAAAVFPEFPLVDPDDAVGIPVACRLFDEIEGRGIYYNMKNGSKC